MEGILRYILSWEDLIVTFAVLLSHIIWLLHREKKSCPALLLLSHLSLFSILCVQLQLATVYTMREGETDMTWANI